jgi:hypothetical protein
MAVLLLLVLAADKHGASFYGRSRMASALGINRHQVDQGLARLLDLGLVAFRPWKPGSADGVWQLLPVPARPDTPPRHQDTLSARQILAALGFMPPAPRTAAE